MSDLTDYVAEADDAGNLPDGSDLVAVLYFDEVVVDAAVPDASVRPIVARHRDAGHDAGMDASHIDAAPQEPVAAPVAHESAPDVPAVAQLKEAIPGGHSDAASVAMAVVAVAGGGAAMKLYSQIARQKHQEKMESHAPCAARIAELEARLESTSVSLGGVDVSELLERIEKLEKAAKVSKVRKVVKRAAR